MAEPALAAGRLVLAAGRHHHLIKLIGLAAIVVVVVIAAGIGVATLVRRSRRRPPAGPAAPGPPARPPADAASAAITADHLTKTYRMGRVAVRALDDVSLEIAAGARVCIMGRSGSGKSTLLRQLGLIDLPSDGRIWLHGQEVTGLPEHERTDLRLRRLGYVFQEYALLPELTAAENIYLPAMMAGQAGRACRSRAAALLDLVELAAAGRAPAQGTLRRRAAAGGDRAGAGERAAIIFADEPTANLDSRSAQTVMQTLRKLNETLGVTVVFVSHDPDDSQYATQVIHLSRRPAQRRPAQRRQPRRGPAR